MRKYFVVVIVAVLATFVHAQPSIQEGTRELSLSGGWDPEGAAGATMALDVGYGVFVRDLIEVGSLVSYESDDDATTWGLGGFAEYHFDMATMTVPYVGFRLAYIDYDVDTTFGYGLTAGVKHFIADNVAIDIALQYMVAGEDIFNNDGTVEDNDLAFVFGLRVMF